MKKIILLIIILAAFMMACDSLEEPSPEIKERVLEATVVEVAGETQLLVEPVPGSIELSSADRIIAHTGDALIVDADGEEIMLDRFEPDQLVYITYDSGIAESYPAQLWASKVELAE